MQDTNRKPTRAEFVAHWTREADEMTKARDGQRELAKENDPDFPAYECRRNAAHYQTRIDRAVSALLTAGVEYPTA